MKRFVLFLMMFLVVGCGICKKVQYVPIEISKDSVVVERLVRDTVSFEIPGDTVRVVAQDSSHLETKWSISDARVDSTGRLHHSLVNKSIKIEKEIVYKEKEVTVEKEVPVIKEVTKEVKVIPDYYRWCSRILWGLLGLFVIFIVLKFKKL